MVQARRTRCPARRSVGNNAYRLNDIGRLNVEEVSAPPFLGREPRVRIERQQPEVLLPVGSARAAVHRDLGHAPTDPLGGFEHWSGRKKSADPQRFHD